jgi:LPPG:FO 2-phospho-L-lactate transferase
VAIVNTGDDRAFYGVHVAPDLDIVTYTLAGLVNREVGYGLTGDTFEIVERLADLGHETWFRLGDRDFTHCLHRTLRMAEGAGLAEISDGLRRTLGVTPRLLPMSEDACPTRVRLEDGRLLHFEEYMIREGAPNTVREVDLSAAQASKPAPGVLETLGGARLIVICPSNPVVSIGPILAVPGVREAIAASDAPCIAISPIIGGAAVKGPASQLLKGIGAEVSARGVAELYAPLCDGFVFDEKDAKQSADIEALGLRTRVLDTLMVDAEAAGRLAQAVLDLAEAGPKRGDR